MTDFRRAWFAVALAIVPVLPSYGISEAVRVPPSFDCAKVLPGSAQALICGDGELSGMDADMASRYGRAVAISKHAVPPLGQSQPAFQQARERCVQADTAQSRACLRRLYARRISDLHLRYGFPLPIVVDKLRCGRSAAMVTVRSYSRTRDSAAMAERANKTVALYSQGDEDHLNFVDDTQYFAYWESRGELMLRWGKGEPPEKCSLVYRTHI